MINKNYTIKSYLGLKKLSYLQPGMVWSVFMIFLPKH